MKEKEMEILKLADSPELLDKVDLSEKLLIDTLIRRKLVVELDSEVAKPLGEHDEAGKQISARGNYSFKFTHSDETLMQAASQLEAFGILVYSGPIP